MSNLTATAKNVWKIAASEAATNGSSEIQPIHLLSAVASMTQNYIIGEAQIDASEGDLLESAFKSTGFQPVTVRRSAMAQFEKSGDALSGNVVHRSTATKQVFAEAATLSGGASVSSLHLLASIARTNDRNIILAFRNVEVEPSEFVKSISFPAVASSAHTSTGSAPSSGSQPASDEEENLLEQFGKDLTEEARAGRIPEIIGRRDEILQTVQALARKKKNNPVLVGDPGVGKSAVVEALALRAVQGKDPQVLAGRRIVELNMGSLLAGTSLRGQFEERLTKIIETASSDPNLILFIDEIHTVMGAGGGAADAANLLKPAMARGTLKLIGATTIDEYRQHIEKDPALDRRFEKIIIDEPPREDAIAMLMGIKGGLEKHHGATYEDAAVETAVDLSMKIDVDNRLPDKAIDLLDRAGAQATVSELSMNPIDFMTSGQAQEDAPLKLVTPADIARVLAQKMGMPPDIVAGHLNQGGAARMLDLEAELGKTLKGQDVAVAQVAERMILAHAPVMERNGPLATMLFLGPSGTGKTELAKQLSIFLFGSDKNLIRFDMSEFKGEHTISKLIGSPPGYVGSQDEGQLTGQIRTKPYSVVLLDEVEKAHPKVYDVFLQVFDEGRITDSKGRLCDARNCIFVMTTNVRPDVEDAGDRTAINEALKTWFRPELINRIDEIVNFVHLSEESIRAILGGLLSKMTKHVEKQYGVEIGVSSSAEDLLASSGYNPEYGAREMRRTLEKMVQIPLSKLLLSGELKTHPRWELIAEEGALSFKRA